MTSDLLFVYGTLMRGFDHPMAQLLSRSAEFIAEARCQGRLYLVKHYPGMVLSADPADLVFGDGVALAFWLNGTDSANCCIFVGGPFTESRYFGEGIGIAVKRGNDTLRLALNWALFRLWEQGRFTDLWLRYFPISPF